MVKEDKEEINEDGLGALLLRVLTLGNDVFAR